MAYWNLPTEALYEEITFRREARITRKGPIVVNTGKHTARSANDKFVVREATTEDKIWWGEYNRPFNPDKFNDLYNRLQGFLQGRDVFVQDCYAGADPNYRMPDPHHHRAGLAQSLCAQHVHHCRRRTRSYRRHVPEFTVIAVPSFKGIPQIDGTATNTFIVLNFAQKLCIIGNTAYAGEIKKSVFTILNYLLPSAGRDADALLREHRERRRHRALLRPLGHGKDHALGRSAAAADRGRRARLERRRGVQFRRRMLREGHSALPHRRAADLRVPRTGSGRFWKTWSTIR